MAMKSVVSFELGGVPYARIYLEGDGPEEVEHELEAFFDDFESQSQEQHPFADPNYVGAAFVVWQALRRAKDPSKPLAFQGLSVVVDEPEDVACRFRLERAVFEHPKVEMEEVG